MINFLNLVIITMSISGFVLFYTFMNPKPLNERVGGFAFMTFILAFLAYVAVTAGYVAVNAVF